MLSRVEWLDTLNHKGRAQGEEWVWSEISVTSRHTRDRVIGHTEDIKQGCISHMLALVGLEDEIIVLIILIIDEWSTMN